MPITTTIEGRPVAQFPDNTSPDVIQRVMKGVAQIYSGNKKTDTVTGQQVQPLSPKPAMKETQRNPYDPTGMMEGMIVPKDSAPSKPFRPIRNVLAAGAEGVNLGMAGAASGLNTMYNYLNEKLQAGAHPDFFKKAVEEYRKNAQYWENVAQKGGISKALHFLGKAIGEAPAGIADFVAGVGPAAVKGAARAKEKGENEIIGAGKGAAERFLMGKVLHATGHLNALPRAGASAGVFAGQTAAQGGTPEQIGEAAVTGAMYGVPGRGRVGIKDLGKNAVEMNKELGERGSTSKKPDVDPAITQDTAARMKKQYTEDKQETPLWLDKGFLPAVKVDGKTHLTGVGHDPMKDIPGIRESSEIEMGWVNAKTGVFTDRKGTEWGENNKTLVPAVRQGKTVVKGEVGDTHPDVMKANSIGPDAEHERGFVGPDGKFMTRARAKQWMKKNRPELYEEWVATVEEGGEGKNKELHSQDLNKAQGLPETKKGGNTTLGMGLGGAQDTILKGLDRWLSPTKEHLKKQGEGKMPAEEWIKRVEAWGSKNPHIKDENTWNGLTAWLDSKKGEKGGVKKDDIMEMLELSKGRWAVREQVNGTLSKEESNRLSELDKKIIEENGLKGEELEEYKRLQDKEETMMGDPWSDRNVPGGIPGTEKVWTLTAPFDKELYQSPHFPDKSNVVVHFRTQEQQDSKGEKGLLIETIQSDWHQERSDPGVQVIDNSDGSYVGSFRDREQAQKFIDNDMPSDQKEHMKIQDKVPPAPFEKSWAEVGLKHALDVAAQDGSIKWVGWSSGKVQNERWGKNEARAYNDNRWDSYVDERYGELLTQFREENDGKEPTFEQNKILKDITERDVVIRLQEELDKESGGSFLTTLYDKRLPKFAKKYAEKLGGKYKDDILLQDSVTHMDYDIHRIDLTDSLRTHINTKGQEFYQMGGPAAGAAVKAAMGEDEDKKKKRNPAKEAFERRKGDYNNESE